MENKIRGICACPVEYEAVGCTLVNKHDQDESAHAPALRAHNQDPQAHIPAFQRHNEDEASHQELFARKADKVQLEAHVGNQDIHVDAADKQRWDGKADTAQLQAHVGNRDIHVDAADKQRWDGKAGAEQMDGLTEQLKDFKRRCYPANITLYLSPTGVDAPDRGSVERPLRSIEYAVGYFSNGANAVSLHLAEGSYGSGKSIAIINKGYVAIYGPESGPAACVINGGIGCQHSRFFTMGNVTIAKSADATGLMLYNTTGDVSACTIEGGGNGIGVQVVFGHARVHDCTINNCNLALYAWVDSQLTTYANHGAGNQFCITATGGLVLASGAQPAASSPDRTSFCGQIFK